MVQLAKISLRLLRRLYLAGLATAFVVVGGAQQAAAAAQPGGISAAQPGGVFTPPLPVPLTVVARFAPPGEPWLPGNRGVDLAAKTGEPVFAATAGVVVYAGELAGRGVVSIGHEGLHLTYEPVAPTVRTGERVERGQLIGHLSGEPDACGPPGSCLHWGVRRGTTYLDPMALLSPHPPVRLLPIWTSGVPAVGAPPGPPTQAAAASRVRAAAAAKPRTPAPDRAPTHARLIAGGAAGAGVVFGAAAVALVGRTRQRHPGVKPRSAPPASPAAAARPWYASDRSGFP